MSRPDPKHVRKLYSQERKIIVNCALINRLVRGDVKASEGEIPPQAFPTAILASKCLWNLDENGRLFWRYGQYWSTKRLPKRITYSICDDRLCSRTRRYLDALEAVRGTMLNIWPHLQRILWHWSISYQCKINVKRAWKAKLTRSSSGSSPK